MVKKYKGPPPPKKPSRIKQFLNLFGLPSGWADAISGLAQMDIRPPKKPQESTQSAGFQPTPPDVRRRQAGKRYETVRGVAATRQKHFKSRRYGH